MQAWHLLEEADVVEAPPHPRRAVAHDDGGAVVDVVEGLHLHALQGAAAASVDSSVNREADNLVT